MTPGIGRRRTAGGNGHEEWTFWWNYNKDALLDLRAQLVDFALEDADEYDLGDRRVAYHRFAHRFGTADVLCDQWAWQVDGLGVTLTCTVSREDYLTYCDLFEDVAATVDVLPRLAS